MQQQVVQLVQQHLFLTLVKIVHLLALKQLKVTQTEMVSVTSTTHHQQASQLYAQPIYLTQLQQQTPTKVVLLKIILILCFIAEIQALKLLQEQVFNLILLGVKQGMQLTIIFQQTALEEIKPYVLMVLILNTTQE